MTSREDQLVTGMLFFAGVLIAMVFVGLMVRAVRGPDPPDVEVVELDGHEYVVYEGYKAGGLTHHEGCPCLEEAR